MLLSALDLQKELKVSKDMAYALMHTSGFPSIKLGGRYYVERTALVEWLGKNRGKEILL